MANPNPSPATRFQPGNKVAQTGKRRLLSSALERELIQFQSEPLGIKSGEAAGRIAQQLVSMAVDGDKWAIEFVWDRTEGKPKQAIEHSGRVTAETVSEEHARLVAESFLDSVRSAASDGSKEPDRVHSDI